MIGSTCQAQSRPEAGEQGQPHPQPGAVVAGALQGDQLLVGRGQQDLRRDVRGLLQVGQVGRERLMLVEIRGDLSGAVADLRCRHSLWQYGA
ncbi:hypothetical protein AB0L65_11150 [Nonomuraea sp. NPDC052116]|uniref:hypothetical protein n=1 Tax=Nonomuraea sp. NPDC052116 TaxID=3155665 RepID=UPI00342FB5CD